VPGAVQSSHLILDGGLLMTGAQVNTATLTNPGSGYTSFPTLTINGGGADVHPAAANVLAGISTIFVSNGGSGYVNQSPASPPAANTAGTFVDIVGGGGTGATAYATVSGGAVTSITIANAGTGYTSMPTIHISSTGISGIAGTGATAVVNGITLQSISLNNGGFDYTSPTITLTGGGGSGATASATSTPNWSLSTNRGIKLGASGGTLYQTAGTTLSYGGSITTLAGSGVLTKSGAGTLVLTGSNIVEGTIISAGTLQLGNGSTPGLITGNILNNGALVINNPNFISFGFGISGSGSLSKFGSGTFTISGPITYTGATSVQSGKLSLGDSLTTTSSVTVAVSTLELAAGGGSNRVLRSPSIVFGPNGKIDLQDNKLITQTTAGTWTGSTYTGVTGMVVGGKGSSNTWNGLTGITTSQSAAIGSNFTTLGVARASDVRPATVSTTALWAGQTITGTDTLVMYTYGGDANLDGTLNILDYVRIDQGLAAGLKGWSNGDFNYDGVINIIDYASIIDSNLATQGAPFPTASGLSIVAVPEPTAGVLLILPALGMLARRRRMEGGR
jgi:fibronectin-binding autotransporter adhesin